MPPTPKTPLYAAWAATIVASSLPLIIWRDLAGGEPTWWWASTAVALLAVFGTTFLTAGLKPIRGYLAIILLIFFLGFGGGWQYGLVPIIRGSLFWTDVVDTQSWAVNAVATHMLRLIIPFTIMAFLLLRGKNRKDMFLTRGEVDAPAEPSRLIGMKRREPWTRIGATFAVIFTSGSAIFVGLTARPTLDAIIGVIPLLPIILLLATMNGFNEEFTLRAAPLSELVSAVGKEQALMLTTYFFGIGHFYGVPPNIYGVALAGFLGWFLGKSILETRGFTWAWLIHFLQDILVFSLLAMAAM